jgi:hypothetical protein
MTTNHDPWDEVGERIAALALKLKLHAEEELADRDLTVEQVVDRITAAASSAADAFGDACKDEAVRQDLRDAGRAIADAVRSSIDDARARVRAS